jgi:drug/metabolite transporter (DMT)-like permease
VRVPVTCAITNPPTFINLRTSGNIAQDASPCYTILQNAQEPSQVNRRRADAALVLNTILWGSTFTLVKSTLDHITPLLFLACRFGLATAALILIFRRDLRLPPPKAILPGIFLFAGYFFQTEGLRFTTPAKSAFLTGLTTVLVPFVASVVYKSRPQASEVVGALVATLGMGLMTLQGPIGSISRGDVLTLVCAFAFALHIVTLGHFSTVVSFPVLSVAQVGSAAICALLLLPIAETPHIQWQPLTVWAILITGLLCTALAFTVQAWAQRFTTSTRTALIYALEPVVALATSYVVAGEILSGQVAVGAALILAGVVLVEVKPLQTAAHPRVQRRTEGL